jgi:catechol 2,3-dioxygenase-like lactoylglutathione lyase family enzyme
MPAGGEAAARRFYADLLGIPEVTKPPELDRGGVWFEKDNVRIHLGVELDFRAAQKAHPGLLVKNLPSLAARLLDAGFTVAGGEPLDAHKHVYVNDPFGNRLELLQQVT